MSGKDIMKITQKEAYKLAENNAPLKYRGSALVILKKLVHLTYNPQIDDPQRQITNKSVRSLMRAANVSERQFERIIVSLSDVLECERHGGKIDYRLNLEPLAKLEHDETARRKDREHRTQKAREKRTEKRENVQNTLAAAIAIARFILSPIESKPVATPKADPAYVKSVLDKAREKEGREPWIPKPDYVCVYQAGQLVSDKTVAA
jgi:hypothetical protein